MIRLHWPNLCWLLPSTYCVFFIYYEMENKGVYPTIFFRREIISDTQCGGPIIKGPAEIDPYLPRVGTFNYGTPCIKLNLNIKISNAKETFDVFTLFLSLRYTAISSGQN